MTGIRPGYIKRADIAWFASQRRDAAGNPEPYQYSYLYAYPIDIPAGARTLVLPDNERIRILAVTVANELWVTTPAQPLYDMLEK
jgi:alpha-mannosidase